jgi:AbrB family looped-hinge helix DNA binding protein
MNMKAIGVVRRVDELGRIVIPKEIRRNLGIGEGDPLEMYLDNGGLVLKPYHEQRLNFERLQSEWDSLTTAERQELICEMVNHLDDPICCEE